VRLRERVFPEFMTHTQANGRWSIVKPALQQLPGDLSDIYVPDHGYMWPKHDWDAVELRIQASIANDKPIRITLRFMLPLLARGVLWITA